MDFGAIAKQTGRFANNNSSAILTALGVTGVVTTAVLSGKATLKSAQILAEIARDEKVEVRELDLDYRQVVKLVWKEFIPATTVGALTIAAIICANRIGMRRTAAIATALSVTERAFEEYKTKVIEKIGEKKEQVVYDEIAQERVRYSPPVVSEVIVLGGKDVLCLDMWSGRYFRSDMETLRRAQNDINDEIFQNYFASLADFYIAIGLTPFEGSYEVGWNVNRKLELKFSATMTENDEPCMAVNYAIPPVSTYQNFH